MRGHTVDAPAGPRPGQAGQHRADGLKAAVQFLVGQVAETEDDSVGIVPRPDLVQVRQTAHGHTAAREFGHHGIDGLAGQQQCRTGTPGAENQPRGSSDGCQRGTYLLAPPDVEPRRAPDVLGDRPVTEQPGERRLRRPAEPPVVTTRDPCDQRHQWTRQHQVRQPGRGEAVAQRPREDHPPARQVEQGRKRPVPCSRLLRADVHQISARPLRPRGEHPSAGLRQHRAERMVALGEHDGGAYPVRPVQQVHPCALRVDRQRVGRPSGLPGGPHGVFRRRLLDGHRRRSGLPLPDQLSDRLEQEPAGLPQPDGHHHVTGLDTEPAGPVQMLGDGLAEGGRPQRSRLAVRRQVAGLAPGGPPCGQREGAGRGGSGSEVRHDRADWRRGDAPAIR
ncbi:hypothetical protein Mame01_63130 [Microbispora amethystogenes]|nr:hypothetical protein Mame01_63130 [Microbispora amethystogenes]